MADNDNKQGGQKIPPQLQQPNVRTTIISVLLFLLVALFVSQQLFAANPQDTKPTDQLITSEFVQAVNQGRVTKVVYSAGDGTVSGTYYPAVTAGATGADAFNSAISSMDAAIAQLKDPDTGQAAQGIGTTDIDIVQLGEEHNFVSTYAGGSITELMAAHPDVPYEVQLPSAFGDILLSLLPILLIGVMLFFLFSQMQKANNSQMSFGKAKAKKSVEERPDVRFDDVAGVDEAVEEMQEIKDFLANPAKYQSMGAKIPRGCLLVGPPGTGKTLLAKAVAGEAGVPFFSISGSDFVEMFVGVGASRVRDLFQQAKEASPSIIFIDEIDAVGRQRGTGLGGGHDEREQTLNQLLVEMDGFEANDSVVLIAATNRADVLDPALLRPGRFDRQIVVDAPDVKGREKILKVHSKDKPLGSDVDLEAVAKLTPGFTGADLANLMNESALLTARRGKKIITQQEVSESMERVIAGPERKGRVLDEHTKHTIAYHESGHALVGHLLDHADPVHKISIISRGRALGYTLSIPKEDKVLNSRNEMLDELAVFMGGRVAEEIFCDDVTTGASNDLERASKMARAMVTQYGMSPLGTQVFGQPNHEVFLGRDYGNTQDYSEETARRIDEEVALIMTRCPRPRPCHLGGAPRPDGPHGQRASGARDRGGRGVPGAAGQPLERVSGARRRHHRPARGGGEGGSRARRASGRPQLARGAGRAGRPGPEWPLPRTCCRCGPVRYAYAGPGRRRDSSRRRDGCHAAGPGAGAAPGPIGPRGQEAEARARRRRCGQRRF